MEEGLAALSQESDKFIHRIIPALPVGPRGKPYEYKSLGRNQPYEIICYGADHREGGTALISQAIS